MDVQYENKVMSSLLLYADHMICKKGNAYSNTSSFFYETTQTYSNLYNYSTPYKQIVSDHSISGANQLSWVYLDGSFKNIGSSNLQSINQNQGIAYFSSQITGTNRISGDYAVKDFNFYLSNRPEEEILFETKYHLRPKVNESPTGLKPDQITYPAIFIKSIGGTNVPAAFGGLDKTIIDAWCIILAESAYQLDAAVSILKDMVKTKVCFIQNDLPFNALGAYTGTAYNYTGLSAPKTGSEDFIFIDEVNVSKNIGIAGGYKNLNPDIYNGFVDFNLNQFRYPRR